jgi:hypothetical protein
MVTAARAGPALRRAIDEGTEFCWPAIGCARAGATAGWGMAAGGTTEAVAAGGCTGAGAK